MMVSRDNSGRARVEESPSATVRVFEVNGLRWSVREVPYPPIDRRSGSSLTPSRWFAGCATFRATGPRWATPSSTRCRSTY